MISSAEQDHLLRRFTAPGEDEELEKGLDRLRLHHWHLWQVVREYREDPTRAEEWQQAEKPSQEWRKEVFLREALKVLAVALYG